MREILFSPPDIREEDIRQVVRVLRSGWITTGEVARQFEQGLSAYCGTEETLCVNSATAALELILRYLGVGPGDQVITSAYTYTATASAALHTGAQLILADTQPGDCVPSPEQVMELVTPKTKAVIGVDLAGIAWDHERLARLLGERDWRMANPVLGWLGRPAVIADAAHSLGAVRDGKKAGLLADFTCFSFHAVKNITTGEGGAVTWRPETGDAKEIYRAMKLLSLHGQSKDAREKWKSGSWEYDILEPAYKWNMTDMAAALGLSQLTRYDSLLEHRRLLARRYTQWLAPYGAPLHTGENIGDSSCHLYLFRLPDGDVEERDRVIGALAEKGIAANVHYKPLPMLSAYRWLGFREKDFPNACEYYRGEITLPLHTKMDEQDVDAVCDCLIAQL